MSGISFNPDSNLPQKTQKNAGKIPNHNIKIIDNGVVNKTTDTSMNIKMGGVFVQGPQNRLEKCIESSILSNNMLSTDVLKTKGFKEADYFDMNGGRYYHNDITGEKVRVNTSWRHNDNKCYEFTRGNMCHSVIYDKNGRAIGGDVQIKLGFNTIEIIQYEIDANGNKIITSVDMEKTENFMVHDGQY